MRPTPSRWLANSALALLAAAALLPAARAATRPHYGGTLRVQTQAALDALPQTRNAPPGSLAAQVAQLIFDPASPSAAPRPGAFRVAEFLPGRKLALAANDTYSTGRPFVDRVEILMAQPAREQMLALQLGRADIVDVLPENARRAAAGGVRVVSSQPLELVALVFSAEGAGGATEAGAALRRALSLSADRAAIHSVLLGRQGAPAAALLPDWISGYAFLFSTAQDAALARRLAVEAGRARAVTLAYDPQDALARAIAERLALDARAAGLVLTPRPAAAGPADARLLRIALPGPDPRQALAAVAAALGAPDPRAPTAEEQYQAERRLLDELRVVPLLHLPRAYGLAPRVQDWSPSPAGEWPLADVWLEQRP